MAGAVLEASRVGADGAEVHSPQAERGQQSRA